MLLNFQVFGSPYEDDDGPVYFDEEEERIRKKKEEEERERLEMEEKMKTMTRKERKKYLQKAKLDAEIKKIEENTANMGSFTVSQQEDNRKARNNYIRE